MNLKKIIIVLCFSFLFTNCSNRIQSEKRFDMQIGITKLSDFPTIYEDFENVKILSFPNLKLNGNYSIFPASEYNVSRSYVQSLFNQYQNQRVGAMAFNGTPFINYYYIFKDGVLDYYGHLYELTRHANKDYNLIAEELRSKIETIKKN